MLSLNIREDFERYTSEYGVIYQADLDQQEQAPDQPSHPGAERCVADLTVQQKPAFTLTVKTGFFRGCADFNREAFQAAGYRLKILTQIGSVYSRVFELPASSHKRPFSSLWTPHDIPEQSQIRISLLISEKEITGISISYDFVAFAY